MIDRPRLVLGMIRSPVGVATGTREVTSSRFGIGRAVENDWTLPDPDRAISKRHCAFEAHDDAWLLIDLSSNGTSLNDRPLEPGVASAVRDGDRIAFGSYEFEARLGEGPSWAAGQVAQRGTRPAGAGADDRLTGDPFADIDGDALEVARPDVGLPRDFDPLSADSGLSAHADISSDHVPDLNQSFRPPRPSFEVLPEDWDAGLLPASAASPAVAAPAPPVLPAPPNEAGSAFAAFASGAGLVDAVVGDPVAQLTALGAAFRAVVSGLRRTLIARATIKGEFRIDQTMIRARGNNPLKFSADDDDALAALLGVGRQAGMSPEQAISEALRDMRLHELAVASAMQHAVRDVLAEFEPARLYAAAPASLFANLFRGRKRRAWDAHCAQYRRVMAAMSDDFDSVFGKSFGRAYEAALADIAAQDRRDDP